MQGFTIAEPKSKGLATPRKKKPKELAVITECCTGCAGSPACVEYCPVEDSHVRVLQTKTTRPSAEFRSTRSASAAKSASAKARDGCFLDASPWDAIAMVNTAEVEKEVGPMAI